MHLLFWLFAVACVAHAAPRDAFLSCLRSSTPAISAGDAAYTNVTARSLRNDHVVPTAIVLAAKPAHISDAIRCARKVNLSVCARSGGHSLVGKSICAGVLIDIGLMRSISVDSVTGVATVGAGATLGELLWKLSGAKRWFSSGVCPAVGVGGYILGGGHGPYAGSLGLACDALEEVSLIDRDGYHISASRYLRQGLFWALCGAGGGQFGIVTEFRLRTVPIAPFDNAVYFRFNWKQQFVGRLLEKWTRYDEMGGLVRIRMEINKGVDGANGLGICFNSTTVSECERRLGMADFFNTPGRTKLVMKKAVNALEAHAFYGPVGNWGKRVPPPAEIRAGFLEQRYADKGKANERTYHSAFLDRHPTAAFWQEYAEYCKNPPLPTVPWNVCELLLFKNALRRPKYNAFAQRGNFLLTHYILGGGSKKDRSSAYRWMTRKFAPLIRGVYINYPELELRNYARMYWGRSLCRLREIKSKYDPKLFFANPQPIPPASWRVRDGCTPAVVRVVVDNPVARFVRGVLA